MAISHSSLPHVLVMTRRFVAKRELVFAALSQAEHMQHWMCPAGFTLPRAQSDLRIGGKFRIEMLSPENQLFVAAGVYRVIEPPSRLVFTWQWEPGHTMQGVETTITIELLAQGKETVLTMTHAGLSSAEERSNHEHGWTGAYQNLTELLTRLAGKTGE